MTQPHDAIGDATSGMAATVPAHACTDCAGASPVGARKLVDLVERGHAVIGHILHKDGQYALLDGSCRWLTKPQYQRLMHEQDGALFGPAAASADQGAKVRAAITDARFVFGGQKVVEDVLHYIEQVLAAGEPVPAQTGITPGTKIASFAKESPASAGVVAGLVMGADPFRAAARQAVMHQAHADLAQGEAAPARPTAAQQADISRHQAAIDRAAAAMGAESAQKVADAGRSVAARASAPIVSRLVVEVDTTQLDAALAKAEQLKVALAGLAPHMVLS